MQVSQNLSSSRKSNKISEVLGAAEQLLEIHNNLLSVGWWPGRPHRPLSKTASHARAVYQRIRILVLSAGTKKFRVVVFVLSVIPRKSPCIVRMARSLASTRWLRASSAWGVVL